MSDQSTIEDLLDDFIEGALDLVDDDAPAESQEQADRLLYALRGVERRAAEVDAVVEARIEEIRAFQTAQRDQLDARASYLRNRLAAFAFGENERTGRKTWRLPAGELSVRVRTNHCVIDPDIEALPDEARGLILTAAANAIAERVPAAVVRSTRILPGEVKKAARPGADVVDHPAPPGYKACEAVLGEGDETIVLPGILFFVPVDGRDGKRFTAKPAGSLS